MIALVGLLVELLSETTTVTEKASLASFFTTESTLTILATLEVSLLVRGWVGAALLGAAARVR